MTTISTKPFPVDPNANGTANDVRPDPHAPNARQRQALADAESAAMVGSLAECVEDLGKAVANLDVAIANLSGGKT